MADENLHVDPQALSNYGLQMLLYSMQAAMPISTNLAQVEVDAAGAFSGISALGAGVFAEGPVMEAAMAKQTAAFTAFASDLAQGIQAIGNAADVCAYAYNNTDVESAEQLNLLGYAFATDPGAKAPPGLPKGVGGTMLDQELAGQGGQGLPDALSAPDSGTTYQVYGNGQLTTYPDGSTRMVQTSQVPGDPTSSAAVTTVTGPNGQVLSTTTTKTRYAAAGTETTYYRKVVTPGQSVTGADGKPSSAKDTTVTTETVDNPSGGQVVKTTTQVGDDKPTTTFTEVPAATSSASPAAGPLQEAQEELGKDAGKVDWRKGIQGANG